MTIAEYNSSLMGDDPATCEFLAETIHRALPEAVGKVWHGHPVWFIDGNPIVGYHRHKNGLRVLFWSGQSFLGTKLEPNGSFKAAGMAVGSRAEFDSAAFESDLAQSRTIQWDYAILQKRRALEKLTDF
ncbi:MAG: hypothetical protein ACKOWN_00735 [Microbacteriaceae bacterium]